MFIGMHEPDGDQQDTGSMEEKRWESELLAVKLTRGTL